ncbi:hypothetical protein I6F11_22380 [Ensifer sp. NBAIM29]|nr:hypothetical protein [Ensifer sp. NBAIM29]
MQIALQAWRDNAPSRPRAIQASSLLAAVTEAESFPELYPFRCNRELIDVQENFRLFSFEGTIFVAKRSRDEKASGECVNAIVAKERLENCPLIPIVPRLLHTQNGIWLVSRYFGKTLHEEQYNVRMLSTETLSNLLLTLRQAGLEWKGLAPRNLIPICGKKFYAIDWEDLIVHDNANISWTPLSKMTIALNWARQFRDPESALSFVCDHVGSDSVERPLDDFELAFKAVSVLSVPDTVTRDICQSITFGSEAPVVGQDIRILSPQEVGHIVTDLFGSPLDVLYAAVATKFRRMHGDHAFKQFLVFFTHNVEGALLCQEGQTVEKRVEWLNFRAALAMLVLFDDETNWDIQEGTETNTVSSPVITSIEKVRTLHTKVGIHAAAERSRAVLHIITAIWNACCASFDWGAHFQLLLRGSISQHLMTVRSDIDFEISSCNNPLGCEHLERFVCSLLSFLMLNAEGSWARPREQDIS